MAKNKRNKVLTEADFINETVAEIVSNGFKNFSGARVAGRIGRHSSRINDLFGGVKGLLKAAITTRDHWKQLFDKYRIPKRASEWLTKELFINMMSENLTAFKQNKEMQSMVLGQMTVYHEALREVLDYREAEAAKMLERATPYFEGSEVCFDMIMALMLYASYGLVLHSEAIKGTAARVDINREEDMLKAKRTMSYLIELAWEDAGKKRKTAKRIEKL
ncbi:hypothetical protein ABIE26_002840 [Pedobacter africanus]|uniref:Uncharacterized protein n=1 Tax=Pedobacter africanus TaxID=151894 RepID=A0ACC6KX00_9SPHI|nr:hypothetical protein [Pedobacter africanus]MDR6783771.1 hypothetical protein [Pedobacter africanus]